MNRYPLTNKDNMSRYPLNKKLVNLVLIQIQCFIANQRIVLKFCLGQLSLLLLINRKILLTMVKQQIPIFQIQFCVERIGQLRQIFIVQLLLSYIFCNKQLCIAQMYYLEWWKKIEVVQFLVAFCLCIVKIFQKLSYLKIYSHFEKQGCQKNMVNVYFYFSRFQIVQSSRKISNKQSKIENLFTESFIIYQQLVKTQLKFLCGANFGGTRKLIMIASQILNIYFTIVVLENQL
eukprot:TRINITY_DN23380_c0_g1_i6.p1 TRINITY_DN23380_c0_g1~~TRINITY_DN23380_c0_g1_i6.p1  ORF type:complete len:233 (+),score=-18.53 TRINITY_DN23380_c0_g1_i6:739-1437(+)